MSPNGHLVRLVGFEELKWLTTSLTRSLNATYQQNGTPHFNPIGTKGTCGYRGSTRTSIMVTANKITDAIKALARVTEAISAWLLFAGGRSNSLMPVAQFNPFEKLDTPIMRAGVRAGAETDAYRLWRQLSDERNRYLEDVDVELAGPAKSDSSTGPLHPFAAEERKLRCPTPPAYGRRSP